MAAKDKISSEQFMRLYHSSDSQQPPHTVNHPDYDEEYDWGVATSSDNVFNEALHLGSARAAGSLKRRYTHVYDVPHQSIDSNVWGDEHMFMSRGSENPKKVLNAIESLEKQGRWVNESSTEMFAGPEGLRRIRGQKAVPYLNYVEDPGTLSYIVPKTAINEKNIRYRGLKD